jgi:hypothetical protein
MAHKNIHSDRDGEDSSWDVRTCLHKTRKRNRLAKPMLRERSPTLC